MDRNDSPPDMGVARGPRSTARREPTKRGIINAAWMWLWIIFFGVGVPMSILSQCIMMFEGPLEGPVYDIRDH